VAEAQYASMYPHYVKRHLPTSKAGRAALSLMLDIIPVHERDALPVDDSGRFYALSYDTIETAIGASVPTVSSSTSFGPISDFWFCLNRTGLVVQRVNLLAQCVSLAAVACLVIVATTAIPSPLVTSLFLTRF
jgi:hypothetical protein